MAYELLVRDVQADGSIVYRTQDGTVVRVDEDLRLVIPPLKVEEYSTLTNNIREYGSVRDPIVLWRSDDPALRGTIVDGMHRFSVATELDVPIPYIYMEFSGYPAATIWMLDNQRGRRNLTTGQKADLGVYAKIAYADIAAERQRAGVAVTEGPKGESAELAGKLVGVAAETIRLMEDIREVPAVHELVMSNVLSVSTGHDLLRIPEEQRDTLLTTVVDRTAKPKINSAMLKPHITAIKAKAIEIANAEAAVVKAETKDEQSIRDRFAAYYDKYVVEHPPRSVKTLTGQVSFYKDEAERRARILSLPLKVLESFVEVLLNNEEASKRRALGETRIERQLHKIRGDGVHMMAAPYTVEQLDILILNGVEITEDTDISVEASKILATISRQEEDARLAALAARTASRLEAEEEERLAGSIKGRVAANESVLGAAVKALKMLEDALNEGKAYCPIHGPECKFDMSTLTFACGTSLMQAALDAKDNITQLAPKTEERKVLTTVQVKTYGGKSIEDKRLVTKVVRVDGDVGKLYREQP